MRILGIDPGIAIVGFGLIESNRGSVRMLQYGAVTTEAGLRWRHVWYRSKTT